MPPRPQWNGPLIWSVLALAVAAVVVLASAPSVVAAAFGPGAGEVAVTDAVTGLLAAHADGQGTYQARFNGRSVFFTPPQRRREEPRPAAPPPLPPPEPVNEEPRVPASYQGPSIRGLIGDTVWFHGDLRLRAGEEGEGVKVLSVDPPWSARLAFGGGEYDVDLFEFPEELFDNDASSSARSTPGLISAEDEPESAGEAEGGATPDTPGTEEPGDATEDEGEGDDLDDPGHPDGDAGEGDGDAGDDGPSDEPSPGEGDTAGGGDEPEDETPPASTPADKSDDSETPAPAPSPPAAGGEAPTAGEK